MLEGSRVQHQASSQNNNLSLTNKKMGQRGKVHSRDIMELFVSVVKPPQCPYQGAKWGGSITRAALGNQGESGCELYREGKVIMGSDLDKPGTDRAGSGSV